MKRFLVLLLLVAGCRTWDVNAFGVPVGGDTEPQMVSANMELTSEEKVGVIVVLAVAVGATVAIALAAD